MRRPLVLVAVGMPLVAITAGAVSIPTSSFLGASAGVALPFQSLDLPPVFADPSEPHEPFSPTVAQLLQGNTIITTEAQAVDVWKRLFSLGFDPGAVDFSQDFLILMGGGSLTIEDFQITAVEQVEASWSEFFTGSGTDPFLAVTATTLIPGVYPTDPPKPTPRVEAVVVSRDYLDDAVFHRTVIALP